MRSQNWKGASVPDSVFLSAIKSSYRCKMLLFRNHPKKTKAPGQEASSSTSPPRRPPPGPPGCALLVCQLPPSPQRLAISSFCPCLQVLAKLCWAPWDPWAATCPLAAGHLCGRFVVSGLSPEVSGRAVSASCSATSSGLSTWQVLGECH